MKKTTIWTLVGLLCLAVSGAICVYDCTHALQPLWHMGVCLFVLLPMAALCFDRSERKSAKRMSMRKPMRAAA